METIAVIPSDYAALIRPTRGSWSYVGRVRPQAVSRRGGGKARDGDYRRYPVGLRCANPTYALYVRGQHGCLQVGTASPMIESNLIRLGNNIQGRKSEVGSRRSEVGWPRCRRRSDHQRLRGRQAQTLNIAA